MKIILKLTAMREKFTFHRLINEDGTNANLSDIIGWFTPLAVFKTDKASNYYIILFHDLSERSPIRRFAKVGVTAFNKMIKERKREYIWLMARDRTKVKYTGGKTSIPDYQKSITVEFHHPIGTCYSSTK